MIQIDEQLLDGLIELAQGEEGVVTQPCHNPAFYELDTDLRLRFVFGFVGPCGQDGGVVVTGHFQVGRIGLGRIATGLADTAEKIVRDEQLTDPTKEAKGALMRGDPVR